MCVCDITDQGLSASSTRDHKMPHMCLCNYKPLTEPTTPVAVTKDSLRDNKCTNITKSTACNIVASAR